MSGELIDATEAVRIGLVSRIVPGDKLMDEVKSMFKLIKEFNDEMYMRLYNDNKNTWKGISRIRSTLHSNPVTKGEHSVVKLDIDSNNPKDLSLVDELLEKHNIVVQMAIKTKNGFHYVLKLSDQNQDLHKFANEHQEWISVEKNPLILVPVTYQGGSKVRLL